MLHHFHMRSKIRTKGFDQIKNSLNGLDIKQKRRLTRIVY